MFVHLVGMISCLMKLYLILYFLLNCTQLYLNTLQTLHQQLPITYLYFHVSIKNSLRKQIACVIIFTLLDAL